MPFVSVVFIAFMAVVMAAYFALPVKWRWVSLLVASYVFYWLNSEWLIAVMFGQTLVTFAAGKAMAALQRKSKAQVDSIEDKAARGKARSVWKRRIRHVMWLGVLVNLGALLFLKYWDFFAGNANQLLAAVGLGLPSFGFLLPVGISFYTLQAIAYLADVQRGKAQADANLAKFMLFMSYFPQILQGPIPRHSQLAGQLYEGHRFDYVRMCHGMQLIVWGFMKKLVIADRLAIPVNQVFDNYLYYDGFMLFLAAAGYGLQVYADFSAGIDIARGFSQMLGIDMVENFRQPYFTRSVEEFWRRWHITLGSWMRDYVFYPLSLSKLFSRIGKRARKLFGASAGKKVPPFIAMFIVFFLVGFWHGANWTFIMYGVWNGVFIAAGILLVDRYDAMKKALRIDGESAGWKLFQMVRSFLICSYGRFFSRASTLPQALSMIKRSVVGFTGLSCLTDGSLVNLGLDVANWVVLVFAVMVLFAVDVAHERGVHIREAIDRQGIVFRWAVYLAAVAVVLVLGVYGSGYNAAAFIYQGF